MDCKCRGCCETGIEIEGKRALMGRGNAEDEAGNDAADGRDHAADAGKVH